MGRSRSRSKAAASVDGFSLHRRSRSRSRRRKRSRSRSRSQLKKVYEKKSRFTSRVLQCLACNSCSCPPQLNILSRHCPKVSQTNTLNHTLSKSMPNEYFKSHIVQKHAKRILKIIHCPKACQPNTSNHTLSET